ncbi:MAG TPA: polyprenyl diphosphate synthase, partial [Candidatus Doudnabacteria bacterium]|nr:polyprenyl diphosphate synthase [Candidatus Doudnabacteria bacterium]
AIIPDGNRRWAKAHRLLPWQGHEEGVKRFWEIVQEVVNSGVNYLTFWAGSYGNLQKRSRQEVGVLFRILAEEITKPELLDLLIRNQTKLEVFGEWEEFSTNPKLKDLLEGVKDKTKHFVGRKLTLLFGYDGQREMLNAQEQLRTNGEEVTSDNLRKQLWTGELPDVDLLIRTGGEPHWSAGFMMWHTANSQLFFTEDFWPAFTTVQLKTALEDFERRERRLGK